MVEATVGGVRTGEGHAVFGVLSWDQKTAHNLFKQKCSFGCKKRPRGDKKSTMSRVAAVLKIMRHLYIHRMADKTRLQTASSKCTSLIFIDYSIKMPKFTAFSMEEDIDL